VAKRPRERPPTRNPKSFSIATFSSLCVTNLGLEVERLAVRAQHGEGTAATHTATETTAAAAAARSFHAAPTDRRQYAGLHLCARAHGPNPLGESSASVLGSARDASVGLRPCGGGGGVNPESPGQVRVQVGEKQSAVTQAAAPRRRRLGAERARPRVRLRRWVEWKWATGDGSAPCAKVQRSPYGHPPGSPSLLHSRTLRMPMSACGRASASRRHDGHRKGTH
jgi:hypothetical protein